MARLPSAVAAVLACSLAVALPAGPAIAAPSAAARRQAEAKALEAKAYFQQGEYENAADAFMEAYAISLAPDMMFNAARAYQEAKRPDKARALFKTYLTLEGVTAEGREEARQRLAAVEAQLAKDAAPNPAGSTPPGTTPTGTPPSRAPGSSPTPAHAAQPAAPLADAASATAGAAAQPPALATAPVPVSGGADALGWGALAGGGLLMAVSGVVYLGALSGANDANAMEIDSPTDVSNYNRQFDQAVRMRGAAVGLVALGTAACGWGVWRLWLRPPQAEARSHWLIPRLAGSALVWGGRF